MTNFVALGELCTTITKGTTPTAQDGGFAQSGINYIKSESISYEGTIDVSKFAFISKETNARLRRSVIRENDILYSIAGANLGKCAVARAEHLPANTNQAVAIIRVDPSKADARFISYCLRNGQFVQSVLAGVAQSAQPNVNLGEISRFKVPRVALAEQKKIAETLWALDDKIELNRQTNGTLEAAARELFRDWFVDFGPTRSKLRGQAPYFAADAWDSFPGRFDNAGMPEGWRVYRLSDLAVLHTAAVNPQQTPDAEFEHFSLPAYDSGQIPAIDFGRSIKSNKTVVPQFSVLLSKLNPEIPRVWLPASPDARVQICSTEFMAMTPTSTASRSLLYGLFNEVNYRKRLVSMVTGTSKSHQRISPPGLMSSEVLVGDRSIFALYADMTDVLLQRTVANRAESQMLAALRDFLLPKMMTGDISIQNAERAIGEVA